MLFSAILEGTPVAQGRPKVRTRPFPGVYYSQASQDYRSDLVRTFCGVLWESPPTYALPIDVPVVVTIGAAGVDRADPDNLAKQVMDALVQAGVLQDDNLGRVHTLEVVRASGEPHLIVEIRSCRLLCCDPPVIPDVPLTGPYVDFKRL